MRNRTVALTIMIGSMAVGCGTSSETGTLHASHVTADVSGDHDFGLFARPALSPPPRTNHDPLEELFFENIPIRGTFGNHGPARSIPISELGITEQHKPCDDEAMPRSRIWGRSTPYEARNTKVLGNRKLFFIRSSQHFAALDDLDEYAGDIGSVHTWKLYEVYGTPENQTFERAKLIWSKKYWGPKFESKDNPAPRKNGRCLVGDDTLWCGFKPLNFRHEVKTKNRFVWLRVQDHWIPELRSRRMLTDYQIPRALLKLASSNHRERQCVMSLTDKNLRIQTFSDKSKNDQSEHYYTFSDKRYTYTKESTPSVDELERRVSDRQAFRENKRKGTPWYRRAVDIRQTWAPEDDAVKRTNNVVSYGNTWDGYYHSGPVQRLDGDGFSTTTFEDGIQIGNAQSNYFNWFISEADFLEDGEKLFEKIKLKVQWEK